MYRVYSIVTCSLCGIMITAVPCADADMKMYENCAIYIYRYVYMYVL